MVYLLQQLANAVPTAALYAALAFGYALIFGMTRRPDITFGALYAFAGQIFLIFVQFAWDGLFLVLPAALAIGGAAAFAYSLAAAFGIARHVMRPLHARSPNAVIVASLALSIVLLETARLAMDSRAIWLPPFLNDRIVIFQAGGAEVGLTTIQLGNTAIMMVLVGVGHLVLARTGAGRAWRAVADDPGAAELCGTHAGAVFTASYLAGAFMAALCGVLATSYYGTMDFASGLLIGLKIVLIAAIGGHSDPFKTALGAALYGLAETLWGAYMPFALREMMLFAGLVLLAALHRRQASI